MDSEDSDQSGGDAQADLSLCWAHIFRRFCCAAAQFYII